MANQRPPVVVCAKMFRGPRAASLADATFPVCLQRAATAETRAKVPSPQQWNHCLGYLSSLD